VMESRAEDALPISDLVMLNKIILLRSYPGWYEVELPDGRKGFVKADQVMDEKAFIEKYPPTAQAIIKTGTRMIGNPYVWGGTSVKGFDCSGFTQTVYKHHGIQLPRDANMQVKIGQEVSMENDLKDLRPADLLFFGSSINRISHVGMYLGQGRYIHCSGLMRVNSFDPKADDYDSYLRNRLRAVRRILK
ncbi:MAG: C40 family peptidase, partial [Planctomycetes bacterium]|nr:C40 family peptidase [Planctomycetota bacterium]